MSRRPIPLVSSPVFPEQVPAAPTTTKPSWRPTRVALLLVATGLACQGAERSVEDARRAAAASDTAFAGVQARGAVAMGVDQFTSTHLFTPLRDGGTIELQRDTVDSAGVEEIRRHMRTIAEAFGQGDFSLPGMVHAQEVPGTAVMRARRAVIRYEAQDLPRGALVRLTTADATALRAIHDFLAFQRSDHHAGMRH